MFVEFKASVWKAEKNIFGETELAYSDDESIIVVNTKYIYSIEKDTETTSTIRTPVGTYRINQSYKKVLELMKE